MKIAPERLFLDAESQVYRVAGRKLKDSNIEYIRADLALSERHQRLVYLAALAEDYLHHIPLDGKGLGIAIALKEELENLDIDLKAALEGEG